MSPVRVLVVDDQLEARFMARLVLEEAGFAADEAESGAAALARALSTAYDVVVLDQRMPGMTGLEDARELRARGERAELVLYSAYLHPDVEHDARELGLRVVDKAATEALVAAVEELAV